MGASTIVILGLTLLILCKAERMSDENKKFVLLMLERLRKK